MPITGFAIDLHGIIQWVVAHLQVVCTIFLLTPCDAVVIQFLSLHCLIHDLRLLAVEILAYTFVLGDVRALSLGSIQVLVQYSALILILNRSRDRCSQVARSLILIVNGRGILLATGRWGYDGTPALPHLTLTIGRRRQLLILLAWQVRSSLEVRVLWRLHRQLVVVSGARGCFAVVFGVELLLVRGLLRAFFLSEDDLIVLVSVSDCLGLDVGLRHGVELHRREVALVEDVLDFLDCLLLPKVRVPQPFHDLCLEQLQLLGFALLLYNLF